MVTQQVEQLARQSYFDALAELFVAPNHADTYDRLRDALHAVAGLAAEVGVDCRELEAALEDPLPSPEEVAAEYGALFPRAKSRFRSSSPPGPRTPRRPKPAAPPTKRRGSVSPGTSGCLTTTSRSNSPSSPSSS